jgi:hypothetical protein
MFQRDHIPWCTGDELTEEAAAVCGRWVCARGGGAPGPRLRRRNPAAALAAAASDWPPRSRTRRLLRPCSRPAAA